MSMIVRHVSDSGRIYGNEGYEYHSGLLVNSPELKVAKAMAEGEGLL